jgi:hypothetical protein
MIKNTLLDLNNHLFEQMERLNDDDLTDEQLEKEIKRADSMCDIAQNIINNANIVLKATELNMEYGNGGATPKILIGETETKSPKKEPTLGENIKNCMKKREVKSCQNCCRYMTEHCEYYEDMCKLK